MLGDLGKLIVAKGLKKLAKVQKIARSGHTAYYLPASKPASTFAYCLTVFEIMTQQEIASWDNEIFQLTWGHLFILLVTNRGDPRRLLDTKLFHKMVCSDRYA